MVRHRLVRLAHRHLDTRDATRGRRSERREEKSTSLATVIAWLFDLLTLVNSGGFALDSTSRSLANLLNAATKGKNLEVLDRLYCPESPAPLYSILGKNPSPTRTLFSSSTPSNPSVTRPPHSASERSTDVLQAHFSLTQEVHAESPVRQHTIRARAEPAGSDRNDHANPV
jgi:hypothetical protein